VAKRKISPASERKLILFALLLYKADITKAAGGLFWDEKTLLEKMSFHEIFLNEKFMEILEMIDALSYKERSKLFRYINGQIFQD
jgi:hypothetical protein